MMCSMLSSLIYAPLRHCELKSWSRVGSELCECGIIWLPHVGCASCEFELRKRYDTWLIIIGLSLCPTLCDVVLLSSLFYRPHVGDVKLRKMSSCFFLLLLL